MSGAPRPRGSSLAVFASWALGVALYRGITGGTFGLKTPLLGATIPTMAVVGSIFSMYIIGARRWAVS